MDIISAYREVGTYRGAAVVSGTTPKTVKRVIARHDRDQASPAGGSLVRVGRERNYSSVTVLVAERVEKTRGRISAKRLLPTAQAAGYGGSARNFRRLVAEQKALWCRDNPRGRRPAVWSPGEHLVTTGVCWTGCTCFARCWPGAGCGSCVSPRTSGLRRRWACSPNASSNWAGSLQWCSRTGWAA